MDVARAADPAQIREARAALASRAGGSSATFSIEEPALSRATVDEVDAAPTGGKETVKAEQFKRFEAMVLQTFIQNMLPKDAEGVYGKGLAGDMWKSQMAEQLADVMADRGGIGIAKRMLADHYMEGERVVPVGPVSGGPEDVESDRQTSLSTSLVHELERRMARSLGDEAKPTEPGTKV
jgi:hypothetical protein